MFFYGTDGFGTFLKLSIDRQLNRQAQASLLFILADGTTYELPSKHFFFKLIDLSLHFAHFDVQTHLTR